MRFATALKQPHHSLPLHVCEAVHWFDLYNIGWQHVEGLNEEEHVARADDALANRPRLKLRRGAKFLLLGPHARQGLRLEIKACEQRWSTHEVYICINIDNCSSFVSRQLL